METQAMIPGAPLTPLEAVTAPTRRRVVATHGGANVETRDCIHDAYPLGSTEGRALAVRLFGAGALETLPVDRFGSPAGYIHVWSGVGRTLRADGWGRTMEWVMAAPERTGGPMGAYFAPWRPGKGEEELLARGRDLVPGAIRQDWKHALAAELDAPALRQDWNVR